MTEKFRIVYPDAEKADERDYRIQLDRLRKLADLQVYCGRPSTSEEYLNRIQDADAVLLGWDIPRNVMESAKNLKIISFLGIGARQFIDLDQAKKQSIQVSNCPGYADTAVAEHTLALLLDCCKQVTRLHNRLQNGQWAPSGFLTELEGKTIGLIGFGGIGKHVARLCHAFGMRVIVWTPGMNSDHEKKHQVELCELNKLYALSDIISLHIAESPETRNLIDQQAFESMKSGAILINTARAQLVEQKALVEALDTRKIASAGIDVFHNEPLSIDDPLLNRENVVLSPHVAFNTPETTAKQVEIAVSNIIQFMNGNIVNQVN